MSKKKGGGKFPVSRIKKIMQSDEEVGKIASVVPCAISAVVEAFLQDLVGAASSETAERGGQVVTPGHVKVCVNRNPKYDFLSDLVIGIPDPSDEKAQRVRKKESKPRKRKPKVKTEVKTEGTADTTGTSAINNAIPGIAPVISETEEGEVAGIASDAAAFDNLAALGGEGDDDDDDYDDM